MHNVTLTQNPCFEFFFGINAKFSVFFVILVHVKSSQIKGTLEGRSRRNHQPSLHHSTIVLQPVAKRYHQRHQIVVSYRMATNANWTAVRNVDPVLVMANRSNSSSSSKAYNHRHTSHLNSKFQQVVIVTTTQPAPMITFMIHIPITTTVHSTVLSLIRSWLIIGQRRAWDIT